MTQSKYASGHTVMNQAMVSARPGFVAVAIFSIFLNLLVLVSPIYMMQVFDRVLGTGSVETLFLLTVMAAVALAVYGVLEIVRSTVLARIAVWLDRHLAASIIATSVTATLAAQPPGGQPLRDLQQIRGFISGAGMFPLFDAPWVPFFVAVIWFMHPWLGMLALASAVLLFGMALINELSTRRIQATANQLQVTGLRHAEAAIRNAEVVQAMGLLPALLGRWGREHEQSLALQQAAGDRANLINGASKALRVMVQIGILGLGALLVIRGELTGGGMIAGSILLGRALAPVEQAIGSWKGLVAARVAWDRLQSLFRTVPAPRPATRLPPPRGHVRVERLTFVPLGGVKPVLKNVSFDLPAGVSLGIVGPSAAGKSTLCRLLIGIWPPTAGHARLDGADIHSWDRVEFGRHVGYLPQDVELFPGTVRDNIARANDASDEEVVEAARLAGVHDMILRLPNGYDTEVGDRGAILSGGQRQRIGLAHALFRSPRLLVLDEPNANLDQEGEAALLRAIELVKSQGTTVIMVAHRVSVLSHVDRLLVLRDGEVEAYGPTAEIRQRLAGPRPLEPVGPSTPLALRQAAN